LEASLSQILLCAAKFFSGIPRMRKIHSAITSSATERVFENGALKTGIPCSFAEFKSTWFVPIL